MTQINISKEDFHFVFLVLVNRNQFDLDSVAACANNSFLVVNAKGELEPRPKKWTAQEIRQELLDSKAENEARDFHYMYNTDYEEKRRAVEDIYRDGLEQEKQ